MVIVTSWVSVVYVSDEGTGAHTLYVKSASDDSNFLIRGGRSARGVSGKFIPDVWETPLWGDAWARGASSSPPTVGREGYCTRPWVGRGACKQRASNEQAGMKWKGAPWGAHGKG